MQVDDVKTLQDLPTVVLSLIATYICDAVKLCHFQGTCRHVRAAINSITWYELYCHQWTVRTSTVETVLFTKDDYAQRHLLDRPATRHYLSILQNPGTAHDDLRRLFASGPTGMEACWKQHYDQFVIERAVSMEKKQQKESSRLILLYLQFAVIFAELVDLLGPLLLLHHQHQRVDATSRMEDVIILTSVLGSGMILRNFHHYAQTDMRDPLDAMAQTVRRRIESLPLSSSSKREEIIVETLNTVFFQQEGFSGNTFGYYEFENSLLYMALQRKRAIPLTLAILYKFVAHRLDVHVDILGLPGHVIVRIPSLHRYVDVFRGGRVLVMEDLVEICNRQNFPFQDDYLVPLTLEQTLTRICANMMNSITLHNDDDNIFDNTEANDETMALRVHAVVSIQMLLREPDQTDKILETCHEGLLRRWDQRFGNETS